jgi:hypothetical protein
MLLVLRWFGYKRCGQMVFSLHVYKTENRKAFFGFKREIKDYRM